MIELSPQIIAFLMLGGVLAGVLLGYPLAIMIGFVGFLTGWILFGFSVTGNLYYSRVFAQLTNYVLLAVPFFVFMGTMLESSGVAEGLFGALYVSLGKFRGGLAIATVLIGTILAACVGVIAASVTMLLFLATPSMLNRGYSKSLAVGSVCAGGTLGILIPPSIMLVVYGPMAGLGVGSLFFGAIMPGLVLSTLYVTYIAIYCLIRPEAAPPVPIAERRVPLPKKLRMLVTSLVPPVVLILAVLGSIFFGIAAPTEAAAVGALASLLLAVAYRRFNFQILKKAGMSTVRISSMVLLIGGLSFAFVGIFVKAGCGAAIGELILSAPGGKWGAFALIMFICFILGMFIDWLGIVFIIVPIITPVGAALGFDPLWFGLMICVNLQMSFMTPPFAYALFYVRGSAPPEWGLTTTDIIRGITPFVILIVVGLLLCIAFPSIMTWLPSKMV